jgi:vancomycin permeability regulator SanA
LKRKYKNPRFVLIAVLLNVAVYLFVTFIKYKLNGLPLDEFRIDYIGNFLNLIVTIVLICGLIVLGYSKHQIEKPRLNFLMILQFLALFSLVFSFILFDFIKLASNEYLFSFPVKKVYTGFLMIASLIMQIYSLIYIWGIILGFEKYFEIRTLLRTISAVVILILFSIFFVWNVSGYSIEKNGNRKYEYALIPGAAVWQKDKPSPIFEGRIKKGLELYNQGIIEKMILTGGNAPGELSEAEVAYRYLTNRGVNFKNLIVEQSTSTTNEQIRYLKFDSEVHNSKWKVLIISDDFHLARTLQMCKFFNVDAVGISTGHRLTFEKTLFYRSRESIALLLFWFFAI